MLGQAAQMRGQLARGFPAQLLHSLGSVDEMLRGAFPYLCPLALDPRGLLLGKQLSVAAGSPARNGDTDASIGTDANYISSSPGVTDEFHETITIVLRYGS